MTLEYLIQTYGYLALLIGTFIEGETIVVLAGLAAYEGYLKLQWVMVFAFLGGFAGDQLYYFLGYFKGTKILEKKPNWQKQIDKVQKYIHKYQSFIIIGCRFCYGFRITVPFALGSSKIKPINFLIFNAIGAILWAITISLGGYIFGNAFEVLLKDVKYYEKYLFAGIIIIAVIIWLFHQYIRKKKS